MTSDLKPPVAPSHGSQTDDSLPSASEGARSAPPAAVILAGQRPGRIDPVAKAEGIPSKALALLEGRPMLSHVITALREAGIEKIAVAANDPGVQLIARRLGCDILPAETGPSASVAAAFETLGAPLLITTADHALLRAQWVRDFLDDCASDADVSVLLARRDAVEKAMPGARRTYLHFADGDWSGCNLFLLHSAQARSAIETWQKVEADRKRPWRIAFRLGLRTLVSYKAGRLTLADMLARLGQRVGIDARLVPARDGLAAVDVDKPSDLVDARAIMAARAARARKRL